MLLLMSGEVTDVLRVMMGRRGEDDIEILGA